MNAIRELHSEHELIGRMLEVIDHVADRISDNRPVVAMDMARILEFLDGYVGRLHTAKEQEALFPLLAESDAGLVYGVIGRLLIEHGQSRLAVAHLFQSALTLDTHDKRGADDLADTMREYSTLMRRHIALEETEAFEAGESELTPDDHIYLCAQFERLERERLGDSGQQHYLGLIEQLERSYGREEPFIYSR